MTSMLATALNLLQPGKVSMKKSVRGAKLWPHDRSTASTEDANSVHFMGVSTVKRARMASSSTKAPTYTGPFVIGWSPKYCGNWPSIVLTSGCRQSSSALSVLSTERSSFCPATGLMVAPPFTLGMSSENVSSSPQLQAVMASRSIPAPAPPSGVRSVAFPRTVSLAYSQVLQRLGALAATANMPAAREHAVAMTQRFTRCLRMAVHSQASTKKRITNRK